MNGLHARAAALGTGAKPGSPIPCPRRLDVIKRYVHVPLEELQQQFPVPLRRDRLGCA